MANTSMLIKGFLYLMLSQLTTRILTFVLNWLVIKQLTPEDYGLSAQFQLLTASILFISREGFRRGCLRTQDQNDESEESLVKMINIAWLSVPSGIILSAGCCSTIIISQKLGLHSPYTHSVLIFGMATVVELLAEPVYILAQCLLLLRLRVVAETMAAFTRCILSFWLLRNGIGLKGGLLFAYAELGFSSVLFLVYWSYFLISSTFWSLRSGPVSLRHLSLKKLFPSRVPAGTYFPDPALVRMCFVYSGQAVVKHILAKGDEMVLVFFDSRYNQGVYSLVVNLGSLVVRSVLQPFEESSFIVFTKAANATKSSDRAGMEKLGQMLSICVKLTVLVGMVFVSFGPSYSGTLLSLLYGPKWSSGETPSALSAYCVLIMALAVNGTTESFLHAVSSRVQLQLSNFFLVGFSIVHMALNVWLVRLGGASGLILANCINMAMRIAYSLSFIHSHFKDTKGFSISACLPSVPLLLTFLAASIITQVSNHIHIVQNIFSVMSHIGIGVFALAIVCLSMYFWERKLISQVRNLIVVGDLNKRME